MADARHFGRRSVTDAIHAVGPAVLRETTRICRGTPAHRGVLRAGIIHFQIIKFTVIDQILDATIKIGSYKTGGGWDWIGDPTELQRTVAFEYPEGRRKPTKS